MFVVYRVMWNGLDMVVCGMMVEMQWGVCNLYLNVVMCVAWWNVGVMWNGVPIFGGA